MICYVCFIVYGDHRVLLVLTHAVPARRSSELKDDVRAAGLDPALMHDAKSGFDASFYRNAQGEVVLAVTGTDEGRDWKHNFGQGLGRKDDQYDRADRKSTRLNSSH